eukprot:CAMPEP_0174365954 /NCGR_PEP_ID=MMETSP0811_2-20130205/79266_1 /TAXON_ID=73025 ORGANISM="Eutreptiella gymnastica-like, Strain CCMP1594" /NCGR_SAMPLE_ID=MMETSP0811_2 /ASSEMBLY_ACC=CAM_ASM_000667 /LENGTH=45 /DNA_ID= /DNA_START= /DNA_END= /DNA_ORIENTATION=
MAPKKIHKEKVGQGNTAADNEVQGVGSEQWATGGAWVPPPSPQMS